MIMSFTTIFLIFGMLVITTSSSDPALDTVMIKSGINKCFCQKLSTEAIPSEEIISVIIHLPTEYCKKPEFILLLKNGKKICVNPKSKWIKSVLQSSMRLKTTSTEKKKSWKHF
ncbi:C-X-C motif chemokine 10-like [Sarcophilus harrisii]|uniref:C-X-C motif chemokine 10-like n=1 Tax=Sarcophilus harrisii TaxID=9305 RepID=UPI001301E8F4|nr:C-X-C motif chemokine 10-like [Sarcophilus harrisii]